MFIYFLSRKKKKRKRAVKGERKREEREEKERELLQVSTPKKLRVRDRNRRILGLLFWKSIEKRRNLSKLSRIALSVKE